MPLVLSLFPGIGMLDMAFEEAGFCIVRGPDIIWGGDIRRFNPPARTFDGVIGGPPCQSFVPMANVNRKRWGEESVGENLIPEFERCVGEARPEWFLMENSTYAPVPAVASYVVESICLNNRWLGEKQNRLRRFSLGTHDGRKLLVEEALFEHPEFEYAVTRHGAAHWFAKDRHYDRPLATIERRRKAALSRTLADMAELQGLPSDFLASAPFTEMGKRRAIGNGVPLPMGRAIARAIARAVYGVEPWDAAIERAAAAQQARGEEVAVEGDW